LRERGALLVTAESCTGGWVSQVVTAIAGSSEWFERGFVVYSNAARKSCSD
jgi:nicotinamide-nucleotide amidase